MGTKGSSRGPQSSFWALHDRWLALKKVALTATFLATLACTAQAIPGAGDVLVDGTPDPPATDVEDTKDADCGWFSHCTDTGGCPNGHMNIDFPCAVQQVCSNETDYSSFKTIGCAEAGYDPKCCSGATCKSTGGGVCPQGQLCSSFSYMGGAASCSAPNCASNADCGSDTYCLRPRGQCQASGKNGVCAKLAAPNGQSASYESGPLCGCDGKTYTGFAQVLGAQISIDHTGNCCDAAKMPFAKTNAQGFTQLEVCDVPYELQYTLNCKYSATSKLCASGSSCFLDIPSTPTLSDADWSPLCIAASSGSKAYGHGGACGDKLAPTPPCSTGCTDPCGCATCAPTSLACAGTDVVQECRGNCVDTQTCGGGLSCKAMSWTPLCVGSCADIQAVTAAKLPTWQACNMPWDCEVRIGRCVVPGCFFAVNKAFSQAQIDVFLDAWGYASCGTCDCNGQQAPPVSCLNGTCVLD